MLGVKNYSKDYIDSCSKKIKAGIKAFQKSGSASKEFESIFFYYMVLVLEQMFVHRLRGIEGKDGNPCNEVRMISNSILTNHNRLATDKTIKYKHEESILKLKPGDEINLTSKDFIRLSESFFDEIENKFLQK